MKKDRNCMSTYPVYPVTQMPQMMPIGMVQMPSGSPSGMSNQMNYNQGYQMGSADQQLKDMSMQLNILERRVSNLENLVGGNYNNSNFQMM